MREEIISVKPFPELKFVNDTKSTSTICHTLVSIAQLYLQVPLYRQLMVHQVWSRFRLKFRQILMAVYMVHAKLSRAKLFELCIILPLALMTMMVPQISIGRQTNDSGNNNKA